MPTRRQRGYMLEVPILLTVLVLGAAFLLPVLPPFWRKVFIATAAVPVLFCLYYMIVIPGWSPYRNNRLPVVLRWVCFGAVAMAVVAGVVAVVAS